MFSSSRFKLLGSGSFSLSYLQYEKEPFLVFKFPLSNKGWAYKSWFFHVQTEKYFLESCIPKENDIITPKIVFCTHNYLIQTYIKGSSLNRELYHSLNKLEKEKIIQELAVFFTLLHKKNQNFEYSIKQKAIVLDHSLRTCLDREEIKIFKKYQKLLKNTHYFPSHTCLCLMDLKAEHILYDKTNKKLGLIDFGSIRYGSPEDEFKIENPIRSHLSLEMIKDLIIAYNKKHNIISIERIKCYLILLSIKEVYSCYKHQKIDILEKLKLKKILLDFINQVESVF